jgi:hypothetical protein
MFSKKSKMVRFFCYCFLKDFDTQISNPNPKSEKSLGLNINMMAYTRAGFFKRKSTTDKHQVGENSVLVYLAIISCQIKALICITLCSNFQSNQLCQQQ